jgi:hypothetical protein
VTNIVYDHTFTNDTPTNLTFTVTNKNIAAGHDLEDYDIAGLKKIADSLYVLPASEMLSADTEINYGAHSYSQYSDFETWSSAVADAEEAWNSWPSPTTNRYESFYRPPYTLSSGYVTTRYSDDPEYSASMNDFSLLLAATNTTEYTATFELYYLLNQPFSPDFPPAFVTDGSHHGFTSRATRLQSGIEIGAGNSWVSSDWIGQDTAGGSLAIPPWCRAPLVSDPPTDEGDVGHTRRGYTSLPLAIMRLNTSTNGFEYVEPIP